MRARILLVALAAAAIGLPRPASGARGSLDSLSWMAGSWYGELDGVSAEEHWTTPAGGLMVCMHRDLKGDKAVSFEFLRIAQVGDSLVYLAQPRGRPETPFGLKTLGGKRVVFENRGHDYPQRISYWQPKPGVLKARTE